VTHVPYATHRLQTRTACDTQHQQLCAVHADSSAQCMRVPEMTMLHKAAGNTVGALAPSSSWQKQLLLTLFSAITCRIGTWAPLQSSAPSILAGPHHCPPPTNPKVSVVAILICCIGLISYSPFCGLQSQYWLSSCVTIIGSSTRAGIHAMSWLHGSTRASKRMLRGYLRMETPKRPT